MKGARWMVVAMGAALALSGCESWFKEKIEQQIPDISIDINFDVPLVDPTAGKGVGVACQKIDDQISDCRVGLKCIDGACKAVATTVAGSPCILSAECADGLYCSVSGLCAPAGEGAAGASCATAGECQPGLYCRTLGFSGVCAPTGGGDIGAACQDTGGCLAGLRCGDEGTCDVGNVIFGFKPFPGVTCEAPEDDPGPPRVYFEVPRGTVTEFFRLPFPSDVRATAAGVDLSGFPTPGVGVVGFDPVQRLVDAAATDQHGFQSVPTVFARFSANVDLATVHGDKKPERDPTIRVVNITKGSPGYNFGPGFSWVVTNGGGKYICPRFVALKVAWDTPLSPGTTYALVLTRGIATEDGTPLQADADFQAMMADSAPSDPALAAAWEKHAALRDWLDTDGPGRGEVLGAAVFTTGASRATPPKVREAVHAPAVPAPTDLTLCDGQAVSPCDDGLTGEEHVRGCFEVSGAVHELHMRVPLPKVQRGTRPYLDPADGGGIVLGADGSVQLQGTESVCVSLTVPRNVPMPEAGWPVAIFGHGTGGTFRSSVGNAGIPLADIDVGGTRVGFAVVGWDGPMHGERRGADLDPEPLFFNVANPVAALGNVYQGAADTFELVRVFRSLEIPAAESPTGEAIRFDPAHVAYVGHSQGSQTGPLAAAYEPDLGLTVWSGAGAGLLRSLLTKEEPVDAKLGAAIALQEITDQGLTPLDELHPALNLVQAFFDPIDPVNHAPLQLRVPPDVSVVQHVLHVYGLGDSYTPPPSIEVLAQALGVDLVKPELAAIGGVTAIDAPASGNKRGGQATGALIQAQPDGYDGHFVMFRDAGAKEVFRQFMGTWLVDGVPTVVAR